MSTETAEHPRAKLSGDIRLLAPADVFALLMERQLTGTLSFVAPDRHFHFAVASGQIVRVYYPENRLTDILYEAGSISMDQIAEAVTMQRNSEDSELLGQVLIRTGAVDQNDVREAMETLVSRALLRLETLTEGSFEFVAHDVSTPDDHTFPAEVRSYVTV